MQPLISIVSPVYRAEKIVDKLVERISEEVSKITENFEIILVEDGSPDNSWEAIERNCQKDNRVKGIKLSRNFGQHYAITAGLDNCKGEWVVVMDCDLQDRPEEIINLYNKALEGYDVVVGYRPNRQDSFFKKLSSKIFYLIFRFFSGADISNSIGNFGVYHRKVINSLQNIREQNRSFGLHVFWSGFNRFELEIKHSAREEGKSSYNLIKLLDLAFDSIIAHSNKLLKLTIQLGFTISTISILFGFWILIRYLIYGISVVGWSSIMVSFYFLSGLIILSIGIVGIYIGKIFNEVKNRPLYLVGKTINFKNNNE